jgi:hypothetical protein
MGVQRVQRPHMRPNGHMVICFVYVAYTVNHARADERERGGLGGCRALLHGRAHCLAWAHCRGWEQCPAMRRPPSRVPPCPPPSGPRSGLPHGVYGVPRWRVEGRVRGWPSSGCDRDKGNVLGHSGWLVGHVFWRWRGSPPSGALSRGESLHVVCDLKLATLSNYPYVESNIFGFVTT